MFVYVEYPFRVFGWDKVFPYRSPFPPWTPITFNPRDWTSTKLSLLHNLGRLSLPREDYHLSLTTLGDYHPLERIITSHTLPSGALSPPDLSNHYPGGLPTPTQSDPLLSFRVLHPFPPQLFLFSCLLP